MLLNGRARVFLAAGLGLLVPTSCLPAASRPAWAKASGAPAIGELEAVGFFVYHSTAPDAIQRAREAALAEASSQLAVKVRPLVRDRIRRSLRLALPAGASVANETLQELTGSVAGAVLPRKSCVDFHDEAARDVRVLCRLLRPDVDSASRDALAARRREWPLKTVSVSLSARDASLRALAEEESRRAFASRGFVVLAGAGAARVAVAGEVTVEDLGSSRSLGVEGGYACRAVFLPAALLSDRKVVPTAGATDVTGISGTTEQACRKTVKKAAGKASGELAQAVAAALRE